MKLYRCIAVAGLATAGMILALIAARRVEAIPAWSRKYDMDCTGCHVAGFRLNRTGQDFLRAGHHMEGGKDEQDLSDYVSVAQKSRYTVSQAEVDSGTTVSEKNSFEQHALSLYMGGQLQDEWYFFSELYWHENSGRTSGASDLDDFGRSKLAEAYLQYLHREGDRAYTSVRLGQFAPFLLHLHGLGARLSQDRPYVINSGTVGDNPYKPFSRQYGLELAQYMSGFTATVAVVNGTGGKTFNRVDNDIRKDVWGTLDYVFDHAGSMLGAYGYLGQYPLNTEIPASYASDDDFYQLGAMGNYTHKTGALLGAVYAGRNEFTRVVATAETKINSIGYYAELQLYGLHPRVQPYARFDFWDPNTDVDDNEVLGPLLGISWRALDHGRLVGHFQQLKTRNANSGAERTDNALVFEANFMF